MKRYLVINGDFDARPNQLNMEIEEGWDEKIKQHHINNKNSMIELLKHEYGTLHIEKKIANFADFGAIPYSILANHNVFYRQTREAFVVGGYYPTLTGACALGERILNNLILKLRDFYKSELKYKKIYKKKSFDDWEEVISILEKWEILLPDVIINFRKLMALRHKSIHYNEYVDKNSRELALQAINSLSNIIFDQFGIIGNKPWFISNTHGRAFIKKEWEVNPFIKTFYLPNCSYVGPKFKMEFNGNKLHVIDDEEYEEKEITDEAFAEIQRDNRVK